jgi:hypothetical protein
MWMLRFFGGNGNGNRKGVSIAVVCWTIGGLYNSKMAEAMAFKRVLEYLISQNYQDMIVKLDVQSVFIFIC